MGRIKFDGDVEVASVDDEAAPEETIRPGQTFRPGRFSATLGADQGDDTMAADAAADDAADPSATEPQPAGATAPPAPPAPSRKRRAKKPHPVLALLGGIVGSIRAAMERSAERKAAAEAAAAAAAEAEDSDDGPWEATRRSSRSRASKESTRSRNSRMESKSSRRSSKRDRAASKLAWADEEADQEDEVKKEAPGVNLADLCEGPFTEEEYFEAQDPTELRRLMSISQPNLKLGEELIADEEIDAYVRARRNPKLKFNSLLISDKSGPQKGLVQAVPRVVVVTGHRGVGGNVGVNGIYERRRDDFQGRAVYQKLQEKRSLNSESEGAKPFSRAWSPKSSSEVVLERRSQRAGPVLAPDPVPDSEAWGMRPAKEAWFLFFSDRRGAWCIGPAVGSAQIYARCPAPEAIVPSRLTEWEVWDVANKQWRPSRGMRALKGGD